MEQGIPERSLIHFSDRQVPSHRQNKESRVGIEKEPQVIMPRIRFITPLRSSLKLVDESQFIRFCKKAVKIISTMIRFTPDNLF